MHVAANTAELDAHGDLGDAVDDAVQAEQQGESDRTDVRPGEQHDTEGDGHQPAQDEQRPGACGLPAAERGEDPATRKVLTGKMATRVVTDSNRDDLRRVHTGPMAATAAVPETVGLRRSSCRRVSYKHISDA